MKISEGKDFQTEETATVKCLEAECSSHVDRTMAGVARETGREGGEDQLQGCSEISEGTEMLCIFSKFY